MRFLTAIFNLIVANFFFILTSLPIITIGASITSLYTITFEIIDGEEVFLFADYFGAFKKKFLISLKIWLPALVIGLILSGSVFLVYGQLEMTAPWMAIAPIFVLFIIISVLLYALPLVSQTDGLTFKEIITNSLRLAIGNFPTTLFLFIIHIVIFIILVSMDMLTVIIGSYMMFMGFAVIAILSSAFLHRIFARHLPKKQLEEDEL